MANGRVGRPPLAVRAAVASHKSWFEASALAGSGAVRALAGGVAAHLPGRDGPGRIDVLFTEPVCEAGRVVDDLLAWMAERDPVRSVGWWTATDRIDGGLAPALMARGFRWGWRPHWMRLDLTASLPEAALPGGLRLLELPSRERVRGSALPGAVRRFARDHRALAAGGAAHLFAAWDDRRIVGTASLHVSSLTEAPGRPPVAGLYNCWVRQGERRRGIGSALTVAAAERARSLGCAFAVLNATDEGAKMYRRVGFRSVGWGRTWWLVDRQLASPRPSSAMVRFTEAVAADDVATMDQVLDSRPGGAAIDLDAPLLCDETPLGLAARFGRGAVARRLIQRGARLGIVTAWDLGWRDEVRALLAKDPGRADERPAAGAPTALMVAAQRGDQELAAVLLAAHPDLSLRDGEWQGDALGWAQHHGRRRIARAIRAEARRQAAATAALGDGPSGVTAPGSDGD